MKSFHWIYLLIGLLVLPSFAPANGGEEDAKLKKLLCKGWKYKKCKIMGTEYLPKLAEVKDRFRFFDNMTFEMVEEGLKKRGNWSIIDSEKKILSLAFDGGITRQLKVEKVNQEQLIYALLADWQYSVTVYMQASAQLATNSLNNTFHIAGRNTNGVSLHSLLLGH